MAADITCDLSECPAMRMGLSTDHETEQAARAAGWHIWSGKTVAGIYKTVRICPEHARGRRVKTVQPEWDEPMF